MANEFIVKNGLIANGGITGNTISATTATILGPILSGGTNLLNIFKSINATDVFVTGGTFSNGISTFTNNSGGTFNVTGFTSGATIFDGYELSTGLYVFTGLTIVTSTKVSIAPVKGFIVYNTGVNAINPIALNIDYSGNTGLTISSIATADITYLLLNSGLTITQQTTLPTPQERRENIYIGKAIHNNRTSIAVVNQTVDFIQSPLSQLRDLWTPINLINGGIFTSPNGVNLKFNTSAGALWGNGINWTNNNLTPNEVVISANTAATFQYRVQTGGTFSNTTNIIPGSYDLGGVVTAIGGGANASTNQRIYLFSTGNIRVQFGQTVYSSLALALAGQQSEVFITAPLNSDNGILIGLLSVNKNATDLSDTSTAIFVPASKFGENIGGVNGSSTTTLQQAYNNSTSPEIVINATLDGLSIKNGTGNADNVTNLLEGINANGSTTSFIRADGSISATTISAATISATTYLNLPTDIRVTGGTYSSGTSVFTNNTGGTFNVTGFTTGEINTASNLTGGTGLFAQKSGLDLQFKSLTSTGGTLNITNNNNTVNIEVSGSTLINNLSGLTVNGNLLVTGTTNFSGQTSFGSSIISGGTNLLNIFALAGSNSNTFTTGLTNSNNNINIIRNDGVTLTTNISTVTGLTNTGNINISGNTSVGGNIISGGTNLNNIFKSINGLDVFVTGVTLSSGTATFNNNSGGTFNVTGFTNLGIKVQESMARGNIDAQQASNSTVYYIKMVSKYNMTVNKFGAFISSTSAGDTWYYGIYSTANALLSSGITTTSVGGYATTGATTPVVISGGTEYWLAWKGTDGSANNGAKTVLSDSKNTLSQFYSGFGLPTTKAGTSSSIAPYIYITE